MGPFLADRALLRKRLLAGLEAAKAHAAADSIARIVVSEVGVSEMALALLTQMSMPPKVCAVFSTASATTSKRPSNLLL